MPLVIAYTRPYVSKEGPLELSLRELRLEQTNVRVKRFHTPAKRLSILSWVYERERGFHVAVGAAARELGGERPQVELVFLGEARGTEAVLLVMVGSAEADAKGVVRLLCCAGIGGGAQMRKFSRRGRAIRHAAAM
jgi:hypothetical protein